jgi:hypothetical protein
MKMDKKITLKEFFEGTMPLVIDIVKTFDFPYMSIPVINCRCTEIFEAEYLKQDPKEENK